MFLCDWTFGRIYFVTLEHKGATYACRKEVFLEAVGDNGFAPTAIVVHPQTGDLFVSIGGRGTRGAVYRIRYPKGIRRFKPHELAELAIKPRSLDWQPGAQTDLLNQAAAGDAHECLRALERICRHRTHFRPGEIEVAVRACWNDPDRYVRQAAADLVTSLDPVLRQRLAKLAQTPRQQLTYGLGTYAVEPEEVAQRACRVLAAKDTEPEARLEAVRVVQLALGELTARTAHGTVWEGYTPRRADLVRQKAVLAALRSAFPTGHPDLDRELGRTLAVLEDDDPRTLQKVTDRLTAVSDPIEDVHYLIVLARLRASRPAAVTNRVAAALLALDRKLTEGHLNRDTNWPLRVAELYAELSDKDPRLNDALLARPEFGRPDHALFARAPGFDRRRAAAVFLGQARKDPDFAWNASLVEVLAALPEAQARPVLRDLWGKAGLEETILPLLARHPQADDRDRFREGLHSPQLATVRLCLEALEKLPARDRDAEELAVLKALRGLPEGREADRLRGQMAEYLRRLTGQDMLGTDRQAWTDWFTRTHPDLAARLGGTDGVDVAGWNKRLAAINWSVGESEHGRAVFTKASCASCHSGAQALGPDLRGVAGRFSRADLFTAILQPSKDISPRYRTTLIETADGKIYQGLIIYEAVDSLILQTGPATTVRVTNTQIVTRHVTDKSLMPAGLLDKLSDRDIADLYAYLKSIGAAPKDRDRK
jgi:putative heme-binding domain-containing protein